MGKYIKLFNSHQAYEDFIESEDFILPNVSRCDSEKDVHYTPKVIGYQDQYLTFVPLENSTFSYSNRNVEYSLDNGQTWTTLTAGTSTPTVNAGNYILWRGTLSSTQSVGTFSATGNFDVQGNVVSLAHGVDFDLYSKIDIDYSHLFENNTKVINAENLILPKLNNNYCGFMGMFRGCTNLKKAPEIPDFASSTYTLADQLQNMFYQCTSLIYLKNNQSRTKVFNSISSNWLYGVNTYGTYIRNNTLFSCDTNSPADSTRTNYDNVPSSWEISSSFKIYSINTSTGRFTTTQTYWIDLSRYYGKTLNISLNGINFNGYVSRSGSTSSTLTYSFNGTNGNKQLNLQQAMTKRSEMSYQPSVSYVIQNMEFNVNDIIEYSYS